MGKMFFQKTKNKKAGFTHTLRFGVASKRGGFTLVETMVAISLFLIVVVIGMGALLNSNLIHQKSRNMRSIMDSLSFIMEDMSRNLRQGYNYRCLTGADNFSNITTRLSGSSCWGVAFECQDPLICSPLNSGDQWVYYFGTRTIDGVSATGIFKSTNGASTFTALNPEEINIDLSASGFSILGAEPPPGDTQQPFIVIKLIGTITTKGVVTPFYLQTSASQRTIDVTAGS